MAQSIKISDLPHLSSAFPCILNTFGGVISVSFSQKPTSTNHSIVKADAHLNAINNAEALDRSVGDNIASVSLCK